MFEIKKKQDIKPKLESAKKPNKRELDPEISQIQPINKALNMSEGDIVKMESGQNSSDSFFRWIITALFSKENISLKTEYLNVNENFIGSKLEFLSKYGNMPYLSEFLEIFETKRVSLDRKGRKEILMALQKREEEIQQDKLRNMRGLLGME